MSIITRERTVAELVLEWPAARASLKPSASTMAAGEHEQ